MVLHPNAGAVLVVGLGCENNQPDVFREFLGEYDKDRVKFMVTQKVGDEYEEGMEILRELYAKVSKDEKAERMRFYCCNQNYNMRDFFARGEESGDRAGL